MAYKLRKVREEDRDLLYQWVNDPGCRVNSFHQDLITYEEHCNWFANKLSSDQCDMYIYCEQEKPIGQIRIDWEMEKGLISYSIISEYEGQGHGSYMLFLVENETQGRGKSLTGRVKKDNIASQIVFKRNGYKEKEEKGYLFYCKPIGKMKELSHIFWEGGVIVCANNRNAIQLITYLEQTGELVSVISEKLTVDVVKRINPQIIISYNYKHIINREIIHYVRGKIFNLHISYLPWNRGSNPNFWSFIEDTPKGVTIHQVAEGLDTGDILVQEIMAFDEQKESFSSSYQKLNERIVELFIRNWDRIKDGTYILKKQEGEGSYHTMKDFRKFTRNAGVDWNENIAVYKRRIVNQD